MRLIIISPPDEYPDEPQVVSQILKRTSAIFHLRKPGQRGSQLAGYLQQIPAAHHHRIMVHGHPRLLDRFYLRGIHFTERERVRPPGGSPAAHAGTSGVPPFIRLSSDRGHHRPRGRFDYIFLSPIFESISKPGYPAAFDHMELKRFLSCTGHTVVALGGIDAARVATAVSLGFKGIAALGAVWGPAPLTAARQLSVVCRKNAP
jgi:thiamine-phosphate pyrophosphorylase